MKKSNILLILLLSSVILLDMDSLAIYTVIGRIAIFDIIAILSILFLLQNNIKLHKNFTEFNVFAILWLCLILYILISGFLKSLFDINLNYSVIAVVGFKYLVYLILCVLLTQVLIQNDLNKTFLNIVFKLNYIVLVIGISQILAINNVPPFNELFLWENIRGGGHRIAATFRWQGILSFYLGIMLPLIISDTIYKRKFMNYIILFSMILLGLYSGSRSFLIILIPSLFIFILQYFIKNNFKVSFKRLLKTLLFIGSFVYIFYSYLLESKAVRRIFQMEGAIGLNSKGPSPRERIAEQGLELWLESPIFGLGSGNLENLIGKAAHNSYLEILYENGIIGLALFSLILLVYITLAIKLFLHSITKKSVYSLSLSIIILNIMTYQFTASAVQYRILWAFLPFIFAEFYRVHYDDISYPNKLNEN